MTRDQTIINAGPSIVRLRNKKLDTIDAVDATGTDKRPGRELEYQAATLHVQYNEDGLMEKFNGAGNAKLVSHGKGSDTTMSGNTVDLFFDTSNGESDLSMAVAQGNGLSNRSPLRILKAPPAIPKL